MARLRRQGCGTKGVGRSSRTARFVCGRTVQSACHAALRALEANDASFTRPYGVSRRRDWAARAGISRAIALDQSRTTPHGVRSDRHAAANRGARTALVSVSERVADELFDCEVGIINRGVVNAELVEIAALDRAARREFVSRRRIRASMSRALRHCSLTLCSAMLGAQAFKSAAAVWRSGATGMISSSDACFRA